MTNQQNSTYNSNAKQVASMVSAIFLNEYNAQGGESWVDQQDATYGWGSGLSSLLPSKMNYSKYLSNNEVMTYPPAGASAVFAGFNTCGDPQMRCYQLQNGGVLWWVTVGYLWDGQYSQSFYFDPDGTGPAQSVPFYLVASKRCKWNDPNGQKYAPGRVMTFKELGHISWGGFGSANPSWFSWN